MVSARTVGILVFPGVDLLDVTGPLEVLGVNQGLEMVTIAHTPAASQVETRPSLRIKTDCGLRDAPPLDVLLVPGGHGLDAMLEDAAYRGWLAERARRMEWVVVICAGALLLAAAGLLREHQATTHWASLDLLAKFPGVTVVRDRRTVFSGKIGTCAGVTSGLDLALKLLGKLRGSQNGKNTELLLEYDPKPPFGTGRPDRDPETDRQVKRQLAPMIERRRRIIERLIP